MDEDKTRLEILEVCSEDAYGGWEFWNNNPKTEEGVKNIFKTLIELVQEKKIVPLKYNSGDNSYTEVSLDTEKLYGELMISLRAITDGSDKVDPDSFYWFEATDASWRKKAQ